MAGVLIIVRLCCAGLLLCSFVCKATRANTLPPLLSPRESHIALPRLDGSVYVFGGNSPGGGDFLENYNAVNGSTRLAALPATSITQFAVLLSSDRILTCGVPCWIYLPGEDRWESRALPGDVTPLTVL